MKLAIKLELEPTKPRRGTPPLCFARQAAHKTDLPSLNAKSNKGRLRREDLAAAKQPE